MTTRLQRDLESKLGERKQLTRDDLKGMSPEVIVLAEDQGYLDDVLGRSS